MKVRAPLVLPILALAWISGMAKAAPAPLEPQIPRTMSSVRKLDAVVAANRRATLEPAPSSYLNAVQVYPWSRGAIFHLYGSPGFVSDVELQAGEALISVAAGDTSRWIIADTSSGSGPAKHTHILIKPMSAGLRTNLVIATDRRVYLLVLESVPGTAMAAVTWTYPEDELLALKGARDAAAAAEPVAEGVAVDRLNFNYSIEGNAVPWRPVRAFDDGAQVFIEFAPTIASGEAPPLFVTSAGKAELVNYRMRGRYYVVDRLFAAAELRLGEKHQQVIRIKRTDAQPLKLRRR